jgi:hypothetical protein
MPETRNAVFEEFFQNIRKATEANLKMQQELFSQWSNLWQGLPGSQPAWIESMQEFRTQWKETMSELARKHREVVDRDYQAAIESLDVALNVTDAKNPEEYRRRMEQLCRKTLDCMREVTEAQVREMQEAVTKMTELVTTASGQGS